MSFVACLYSCCSPEGGTARFITCTSYGAKYRPVDGVTSGEIAAVMGCMPDNKTRLNGSLLAPLDSRSSGLSSLSSRLCLPYNILSTNTNPRHPLLLINSFCFPLRFRYNSLLSGDMGLKSNFYWN